MKFNKDYKVLSNGVKVAEKETKDGNKLWHYKMNHPHQSYLVMLGIGKYEIKERRPGDIDACYADPSYAYEKLGWKAEKDINEMCRDAYNFVKKD